MVDNTDWKDGAFDKKDQPRVHRTGYFASQGANWAYQFGIAKGKDGNTYEVVTVFGEVKGYQRVWL